MRVPEGNSNTFIFPDSKLHLEATFLLFGNKNKADRTEA